MKVSFGSVRRIPLKSKREPITSYQNLPATPMFGHSLHPAGVLLGRAVLHVVDAAFAAMIRVPSSELVAEGVVAVAVRVDERADALRRRARASRIAVEHLAR